MLGIGCVSALVMIVVLFAAATIPPPKVPPEVEIVWQRLDGTGAWGTLTNLTSQAIPGIGIHTWDYPHFATAPRKREEDYARFTGWGDTPRPLDPPSAAPRVLGAGQSVEFVIPPDYVGTLDFPVTVTVRGQTEHEYPVRQRFGSRVEEPDR